jgi:two-component system, LuxR family, response regulator FixJ
MNRVFVVDDEVSVRRALGEMLHVYGFTTELYDSATGFLRAITSSPVGCVLADVRMPVMNGIALVRELARREIGLPTVLISGHADVRTAVDGIKAGAEDLIEKPIDDRKLGAAINRAISRSVERRVQQQEQKALRGRFLELTSRQVEVFDLVARGATSQAIAEKLDISVRTVEGYRAQIMEKMHAKSTSILVHQAFRLRRLD